MKHSTVLERNKLGTKSNQITFIYIALCTQLISQSAVQKPSLKPQTTSNAGVEARGLGKTP